MVGLVHSSKFSFMAIAEAVEKRHPEHEWAKYCLKEDCVEFAAEYYGKHDQVLRHW